VHKNSYLSVALIWTCSILLLCLEPASDLPKIEINNVDKLAHFTFHFVFIILWYLYFKSATNKINYQTSVILFLVSLVFGIGIEWSQQVLTTSRKGDVLDVISNISGAFTALVILLSVNYYSNNKTKI
jgi:hypothetical protein